MSNEARERFLEDLRARGLLADEEVRTARRLLAEADDAGREVSLSEVLIRAGAEAAKARRAAAAFEATEPDADAGDAVPIVAPESSGLELLERIGRGSQAVVYKCRQVEMDRVVAVKILHPRAAGDADARERFLHEARAAAVLTHPNIVTIHEIRPLANTVAIIMEYVDGGTLADLLKVRKRFDPAEAVAIVRQVAEGLRAAHDRDLIHRDVKPRNIMLTSEGRVKLADMGLARHVAEADGAEGKAFGTPYYISPEQVTGDPPPDHRTDLYSLGVTFYEMVAGRPPFVADEPHRIMRMHVLADAPDPRDFVPDLPQTLCWLLAKAMAREPEDRYQSAEDFIEALDRLDLSVEPAEAPAALVHQVAPLAARERRRGSRVAAMVPRKGVRPGREGRGPSAGEAPAVKRKPMPAPVVGLLALVGVAAVAGLFLLVLYAGGFLGGEPAPETRSGAGAQAPGPSRTEPIPEGSERMSRAERNAQAALASARRLENTPDTPHNEVLLAYRNVITFYPGTRHAGGPGGRGGGRSAEGRRGSQGVPAARTAAEGTHAAARARAAQARADRGDRYRGPRLRGRHHPRPGPEGTVRERRRPGQHRQLAQAHHVGQLGGRGPPGQRLRGRDHVRRRRRLRRQPVRGQRRPGVAGGGGRGHRRLDRLRDEAARNGRGQEGRPQADCRPPPDDQETPQGGRPDESEGGPADGGGIRPGAPRRARRAILRGGLPGPPPAESCRALRPGLHGLHALAVKPPRRAAAVTAQRVGPPRRSGRRLPPEADAAGRDGGEGLREVPSDGRALQDRLPGAVLFHLQAEPADAAAAESDGLVNHDAADAGRLAKVHLQMRLAGAGVGGPAGGRVVVHGLGGAVLADLLLKDVGGGRLLAGGQRAGGPAHRLDVEGRAV